MKLDFLKTLQELQPCGLRPIIEPLNDTYPVMAFSEWKSVAIDLMDDGFVSRAGNGQYRVTPAGQEAIQKGAEFFDNNEPTDTDAEETSEDSKGKYKPSADHPWHQPLFTRKQKTGEVPINPRPIAAQPKRLEQEKQTEPKPPSDSETELDEAAGSLSASIKRPIDELSTDDLLAECALSKNLIDSLSHRRCTAVREIQRRMEGL